uniref:Protein XRI1 n=1 Tax=Oryza rufipogon TaxID=4529 RepID=A0A0E0QR73_ORYRU
MDPSGGGGVGGISDEQILWDWQAAEHCESNAASHDVSRFMWDCLNQDDDDLLGLLGNQTPLRDCRGFFDIDDFTCKETLDLEESRESKRRRILEYPSESNQSEDGNREISSTLGTSELTEILASDTIDSLSTGAFYQSSHSHSKNCSDENQMHFRHDQMHSSQESVTYTNDQSGISGTTENDSVTESLVMQETRKLSTLKVSKGASLVKAKQNLTTTIAYPFTLIKPSWEEGDVITLKDINQRIRAPPKKAPETLGTSAFSGKPVVGKTRIRTDGGRGSITILRTKG